MSTPFTPAFNDLAFRLASDYVPGSGTVVMTDLSALPSGVPSSSKPLRLSFQRAKDGAKSIIVFAGKSGNSLTGGVVAEGKTDVPLYAGDYAAVRFSAGYINDLEDAVVALQSEGEGIRIESDGTQWLLGFYGVTAVARAASPGTASGTDATVINAVVTLLRNLGLCS